MLKAMASIYPGGVVHVSGKQNFIAKTLHRNVVIGLLLDGLVFPRMALMLVWGEVVAWGWGAANFRETRADQPGACEKFRQIIKVTGDRGSR